MSERSRVEFRAIRETLGISYHDLARSPLLDHTVSERTVKRWENGERDIPDDAWRLLDQHKLRQDAAVEHALEIYDDLLGSLPDDVEHRVALRYWTSEAEYLERSTGSRLGTDDDWLMANATTRRLAAVLEDMGVTVEYTNEPLPARHEQGD